ncbi:hypothetical protein CHF27_006435 [Romboutsia maritimum]|uniref:Uncharacterized protein n=1 Tax=Romboutsia maritimum TaxID=2020948 RepID=A0A371ITD7_9FIRM|nr:hypothetical protein [Romboutsia maritimum]RDY23756.1 hypothetical protein CHF27_006435 [Romboutsia maritimum]
MKFKLKNKLYKLLIDVPEIEDYVIDIIQTNVNTEFKIKKEDIREVQLLINDEIVLKGLDNQDTVNKLGIKLYELYDEILYQKDNQNEK